MFAGVTVFVRFRVGGSNAGRSGACDVRVDTPGVSKGLLIGGVDCGESDSELESMAGSVSTDDDVMRNG